MGSSWSRFVAAFQDAVKSVLNMAFPAVSSTTRFLFPSLFSFGEKVVELLCHLDRAIELYSGPVPAGIGILLLVLGLSSLFGYFLVLTRLRRMEDLMREQLDALKSAAVFSIAVPIEVPPEAHEQVAAAAAAAAAAAVTIAVANIDNGNNNNRNNNNGNNNNGR